MKYPVGVINPTFCTRWFPIITLNKAFFPKTTVFLLLTNLLLFLSYPPANMGYLAWIALVPLFIFTVSGKKYLCLNTLLIGTVFFFVQLSWMRHVTYIAWVLLSLYCSVYFLLFAVCARYVVLKLKWPLILAAPCLWAALEFIRSFFLSGFPWFFIGHTQYQWLPVIQISDITGVYGISFIIVMVNAGIADLILSCPGLKSLFAIERYRPCLFPNRKLVFTGVVCVLPLVTLIATLFYGFYRLKNYVPVDGPKVCLVQGNIPQDLKFESTEADQVAILKKYFDLSKSAKDKSIDLLVWPETMMPGILNINPDLTGRKIDILSQLTAVQLAQDLGANLLVGGIALTLNGEQQIYYNSAYHYNRLGSFVGRYDKIHLVPFGEFTPLKDYFPFLAGMVPYEIGLTHGKNRTLFSLDTAANGRITFGVSICYEDTVPSLMRRFRKDGAEFMLNITNDGWFCNSAELDQHLAIMVFRAVENRISLARAANTGISAFVAPNGTIYDMLVDAQGKYREISGTLTNHVRLANKDLSIYTRCGDWFGILCAVVSSAVLLAAVFNVRMFSMDRQGMQS
ncbi:MAG: apolipoprotein N-acyltransferase [Planctomycetota bacterium]